MSERVEVLRRKVLRMLSSVENMSANEWYAWSATDEEGLRKFGDLFLEELHNSLVGFVESVEGFKAEHYKLQNPEPTTPTDEESLPF
tara:strand:+ start:549 stop:809 length:261 start_codon:yes stop_codon:yes gene_type:complete